MRTFDFASGICKYFFQLQEIQALFLTHIVEIIFTFMTCQVFVEYILRLVRCIYTELNKYTS